MVNQLSPQETAERYERIAALTRAGYTAERIAQEVGVTARTVQRARGRMGVAQPFCGIPLTGEELARAAAMLDDGASYGEVARTLGRGLATLRKRLPGRSAWPQSSGAPYGRYFAQVEALPAPALGVAS